MAWSIRQFEQAAVDVEVLESDAEDIAAQAGGLGVSLEQERVEMDAIAGDPVRSGLLEVPASRVAVARRVATRMSQEPRALR